MPTVLAVDLAVRGGFPELFRGGLDPAVADQAVGAQRLEKWCQKWHHGHVASIEKIEQQARKSPENVSYSDMLKLCAKPYQVKQAIAAIDRSKEK